MICGRQQCTRNVRGVPLRCRCGIEFCSEACFVSAWHAEHQLSCPQATDIKADIERRKANSDAKGTKLLVAVALSRAPAAQPAQPESARQAPPVPTVVPPAAEGPSVPSAAHTPAQPSGGASNAGSAGSEAPTTSTGSSTPLTSSQFKRYQLDEFVSVGKPIGSGSYGLVTKVVHTGTAEIFAMKAIPKKKVMEQRMTAYLMREVKTQLRLQHPNILRLHYYFEDAQNVHLLLEYARDGSLFSVLRKLGRLKDDEAANMYVDVAGALDFLHRNAIIHRDLKPENILICAGDDGENVAKLADFGWCAELAQNEGMRNTFCGTWDYLSPEMIQNEPHDSAVDIWAIGVLLFEMLLGRPPFAANSQVKVMARITKVDLQIPESVSPLAGDLIRQLLVKEASKRLELVRSAKHTWVQRYVSEAEIRKSFTLGYPTGVNGHRVPADTARGAKPAPGGASKEAPPLSNAAEKQTAADSTPCTAVETKSDKPANGAAGAGTLVSSADAASLKATCPQKDNLDTTSVREMRKAKLAAIQAKLSDLNLYKSPAVLGEPPRAPSQPAQSRTPPPQRVQPPLPPEPPVPREKELAHLPSPGNSMGGATAQSSPQEPPSTMCREANLSVMPWSSPSPKNENGPQMAPGPPPQAPAPTSKGVQEMLKQAGFGSSAATAALLQELVGSSGTHTPLNGWGNPESRNPKLPLNGASSPFMPANPQSGGAPAPCSANENETFASIRKWVHNKTSKSPRNQADEASPDLTLTLPVAQRNNPSASSRTFATSTPPAPLPKTTSASRRQSDGSGSLSPIAKTRDVPSGPSCPANAAPQAWRAPAGSISPLNVFAGGVFDGADPFGLTPSSTNNPHEPASGHPLQGWSNATARANRQKAHGKPEAYVGMSELAEQMTALNRQITNNLDETCKAMRRRPTRPLEESSPYVSATPRDPGGELLR